MTADPATSKPPKSLRDRTYRALTWCRIVMRRSQASVTTAVTTGLVTIVVTDLSDAL